MPRVVKHPEIRRGELLDCAEALFMRRGYDKTSLNDVIAAAGVSKGGFYHYFPSKEALLEALAERSARQILARVEGILDDPSLDALARLNEFLARSRQFKIETAKVGWAVFEAIFRPENAGLLRRIHAAATALVAPILQNVIAQGVEEGIFDTSDPQAAAEMFLQFGVASNDLVMRFINAESEDEALRAVDALDRRLQFQGIAMDRVLGLPDGSLRLAEPGYVRAVMAARRG
jgi:AcrR family transcriptional regulator